MQPHQAQYILAHVSAVILAGVVEQLIEDRLSLVSNHKLEMFILASSYI